MKWGLAGAVGFCACVSIWALVDNQPWASLLWAFLAFVNSLSTRFAFQREALAG